MSTDNSMWLRMANPTCHRRWWWITVENTNLAQYQDFQKKNIPRLQLMKDWGQQGNEYRLELITHDDFKTIYSLETDISWAIPVLQELPQKYPQLKFKITLHNPHNYFYFSQSIQLNPNIAHDLALFQKFYAPLDQNIGDSICTHYVNPPYRETCNLFGSLLPRHYHHCPPQLMDNHCLRC